MSRIGFLIPEFPGQTHAFFIRERNELDKLGVQTQIISTRRPVGGAGMAQHEWAEASAKETVYLFPLSKAEIIRSALQVLAKPGAWLTCLCGIFGNSDMSVKERLKMFGMLLTGAHLKIYCEQNHLKHVHVHSCANSANVAMFSRILGGPTYSLTLHGPMHDYGTNQANKWKFAAYCIVITQELMAEVQEKLAHIQLPPRFLAPMGVNVEAFKRTKTYEAPKEGETIRLVSCGRLNAVKAHDDLIRAVASLKNKGITAQLNICGATDSQSDLANYANVLKDLCKELDVEQQVNFLGSVSEARVKQELEDAHFFCLASLKEPLGVAIMEGMALETPAIVARSPGVEEMIDDGIDGVLVEPRAPEQFVDAITDLIANPDKALALSPAGREKVLAKFHSGISAAKIAEGYRQTHGE